MKDRSTPAQNRALRRWPRLVDALLTGHSALGLAFAAIIYLLCLTGTISVFAAELQRWEQPLAPRVLTLRPAALDRALAAIRHAEPRQAASLVTFSPPTAATPYLVISAGDPDAADAAQWYADDTGRLVRPVQHFASDLITQLHGHLLLPRVAGLIVVGIAGIALLALIVSGLLAHPRILRDAFVLRRGGAARTEQTDLHNRLGTWGLPFSLLIALTGALLGIFLIVFGGVAATAYKGDLLRAVTDLIGPVQSEAGAAAPLPCIACLVAADMHGRAVTLVSVDVQRAGTDGQRIGITVRESRSELVTARTVYDGAGRRIFPAASRSASSPEQLFLATQPLHFGNFGGWPIKIAYGLLGFVLCVVTVSGIRIWLVRRGNATGQGPYWERLWLAVQWGQPLALTLCAGTTLVADGALWPKLMWGAASGAAIVGAIFARSGPEFSRILPLLLGVALLCLAITHATTSMAAPASVSGVVDILFLAGALWLIGSSWLTRRGRNLPRQVIGDATMCSLAAAALKEAHRPLA